MIPRRPQYDPRMQRAAPQPNRDARQNGAMRAPSQFAPRGPNQSGRPMFQPPVSPSMQPGSMGNRISGAFGGQPDRQYGPHPQHGDNGHWGPGPRPMPPGGFENKPGYQPPQPPQGRDPYGQAQMPTQLSPQQAGFQPLQPQQPPAYPQPQMPQQPQQPQPDRIMGPAPYQPTVSGVPVHSQVPGWDGQGPLPVGWAEVSPGVYVENWNGLSPEQRSAVSAYGNPYLNNQGQQAAGGYIDNGPQQLGPIGGGMTPMQPLRPLAPEDQGQRIMGPYYGPPERITGPYYGPQGSSFPDQYAGPGQSGIAGGPGNYQPNQGLEGLTPEQWEAINHRLILGHGGGGGPGGGPNPTVPPALAGMASGAAPTTQGYPTGSSPSSNPSWDGRYGAGVSRPSGTFSAASSGAGQGSAAGLQPGQPASGQPGAFGSGGMTNLNGGAGQYLAAAGVDPRPGVKSQGPPPEDFMLPTSPQFEEVKRSLDQELWNTLAQLDIAEAQIPGMVELVKARMDTDMGYTMSNVDESMIDRGIYGSSIRQDARTAESIPFQRRWQDFMGEVAGQYGEIANARTGAKTSYNQRIAELLLGLAGDAATTPGSGVWEGEGGGDPWEDEAPGGYQPGTGYQDPNMPGGLKPQPGIKKPPKKPSKPSKPSKSKPTANRQGRRSNKPPEKKKGKR